MKMRVSKNEFVLFILRIVNIKENLITCMNANMQKKDLAKFMILEDVKNQQVLHKNGLYMPTQPNKMQPEHGYHRECYQPFTMNLGRLKQDEYVNEKSGTSRRSSTTNSDRILFKADCIFCNKTGVKKIKSKGVWTTESMSKSEYDGGLAVKETALRKGDQKLMCRIADVYQFACKSCRRDYLRNQDVGRSKNEDTRREQKELEEAYALAFSKIREIIDQEIILTKNFLKLSELREKYVEYLAKARFPNPAYRGEKLKS